MNNSSTTLLLLTIALAMIGNCLIAQDDHTIVTITDDVLVEDTRRFGMNTGGSDNYWDLQFRKQMIEANFEGLLHRYIFLVWDVPADGRPLVGPGRGGRSTELPVYVGGKYVVISGESKWQEGTITGVETVQYEQDNGEKRDLSRLILDPPLSGPANAIMLENIEQAGYVERSNGIRVEDNTDFAFGDVPEGTFGDTALKLDGSEGKTALVRLFPGNQEAIDCNIPWGVRFHFKAVSGEPNLRFHSEGRGEEFTLDPGEDWALHDGMITVTGMPENPDELTYLRFIIEVTGGVALIDDLEIWRTGHQNPTLLRDPTLKAMKEAKLGNLRNLQGSNNTLVNTILPKIRSYNAYPSLHKYYEACEAIGAAPYFCLPSTLTREEITQFMEYLGAPADVGLGKLRAELGQPAPWLEVLPEVIIEFGNELYNFGGFGGPDYWHDLIETGKASPYYDPEKIIFTMGHQGDALEHAQNMDSFSTGGYICWGFTKEDYEKYLSTDADLFRWAAGWSLWDVLNPEGRLAHDYRRATGLGIELAMYEGAYHTNFGDGPSEPRNRLITSAGGATIYLNHMLLKLRELGMRRQSYFALGGEGHKFSGTGAFGSEEAGYVRVWGKILRLPNIGEGDPRFRPGWLALSLVNNVMLKDLVATRQSGEDPKFTVTATFPSLGEIKRKQTKEETLEDLPTLFSYAFREGDRRSIILVNVGTEEPREVELQFPGDVQSQTSTGWLLRADTYTANNEVDWNPNGPRVTLETEPIADFAGGYRVRLAPYSMVGLTWKITP